jgi:dihydroxyacid dehydratase/phosphogluconate dehydratase
LGLVHPAVELLTDPPTQEQVNRAIDPMFAFCNDPNYGVSSIVRQNIENCIRVHSATGGSTNLMMHIVSAMIHAGVDFTLWDYDRIRRATPIPDLLDYSLTEGRDIFALAQQCCDGDIRGMETVVYELLRNGVPMHLDAPTVTGTTWGERLADTTNLAADNVKNNPVILAQPRRPFSGVDVFQSNFFESAVAKISGMKTEQLDEFDEKAFFGLYYENEEDVTKALLNVRILADLRDARTFAREDLIAMANANAQDNQTSGAVAATLDYDALFDRMVAEKTLKLIFFISGQGPLAFGMPEQYTPSQHINANRQLYPLSVMLSDGRYSGATYGAAVGHITPEAANGGGILYLQTGDVFAVRLRERRIDLIDREAFRQGRLIASTANLAQEREALGKERLERIRERRERLVAPTNVMRDVTDAARGVVPLAVAEAAREPYRVRETVV